MDKQFARIMMLSVLLPAGAVLAEAVDHDHFPVAASHQITLSRLAQDPPADLAQMKSIEGRRFMAVISAEEDTAVRRRTR
jgi:hypothetical protein